MERRHDDHLGSHRQDCLVRRLKSSPSAECLRNATTSVFRNLPVKHVERVEGKMELLTGCRPIEDEVCCSRPQVSRPRRVRFREIAGMYVPGIWSPRQPEVPAESSWTSFQIFEGWSNSGPQRNRSGTNSVGSSSSTSRFKEGQAFKLCSCLSGHLLASRAWTSNATMPAAKSA